jgi:hypothetical protein
MKKVFHLGVVLAFLLALVPAGASAEADSFPLYAGQNIEVGYVDVSNDTDLLYVQYVITDMDWCITKTHLHVAEDPGEIPQKNGNPIPGKFDYSGEHECVTEALYEIPLIWDPGDIVIAAHAVMEHVVSEAPYPASSVFDYDQGQRKDGTAVLPARSIPEQGLAYDSEQSESSFFSLGFGGWIIVEFDCPITNGEGNDIQVVEDTWGSYPLETAEIYASQDGSSWIDLGEADNTNNAGIHTISEFDLNGLDWATYIKVVDTTDSALHNNTADGYDLNAVLALQDCMGEDETAWGGIMDFPGKNWARYFLYGISPYAVGDVDLFRPGFTHEYAADFEAYEEDPENMSFLFWEQEVDGTSGFHNVPLLTYIEITGNTAVFGGVVTASHKASRVGQTLYIYVEDNGPDGVGDILRACWNDLYGCGDPGNPSSSWSYYEVIDGDIEVMDYNSP